MCKNKPLPPRSPSPGGVPPAKTPPLSHATEGEGAEAPADQTPGPGGATALAAAAGGAAAGVAAAAAAVAAAAALCARALLGDVGGWSNAEAGEVGLGGTRLQADPLLPCGSGNPT